MAGLTTIREDDLEATIDAQGAQLLGLELAGREYLWQRDPRWWPRSAPILFPIVGCLRNDFATSAAGDVHLRRHGLARNYEHTVVDEAADHVTYQLDANDEMRAAFPYDWRLNMTYALEDGHLRQTYHVTNTGTATLPFTLGGHPAFNVPLPGTDEAFDDYELVFDRPWHAESPAIDEAGLHDFGHPFVLLDGSDTLPLRRELFTQHLTLTFQDVPGHTVRLQGQRSGHGVELDFPGFGYLGVWSAEHDAPFVAVEPWVGCATALDEGDVFEQKRGMLSLEPGQSLERSFTIRPF